jgi:hypothetical protein
LAAPVDDVAADLRDQTDVIVPGSFFSGTGERPQIATLPGNFGELILICIEAAGDIAHADVAPRLRQKRAFGAPPSRVAPRSYCAAPDLLQRTAAVLHRRAQGATTERPLSAICRVAERGRASLRMSLRTSLAIKKNADETGVVRLRGANDKIEEKRS